MGLLTRRDVQFSDIGVPTVNRALDSPSDVTHKLRRFLSLRPCIQITMVSRNVRTLKRRSLGETICNNLRNILSNFSF